ncbi:cysteine protease ATG4D-like [Gouania willdenowi]|uniref:cysteine protease ATG4D-like n=1 Tax=Gouania willdenowi TaxID=441366 RepID=UPI001054A3C9|nr:cysteine protease ATG4D-like [Gouania willdenowi]
MDDWLFLSHESVLHLEPDVGRTTQQEETVDGRRLKSRLVSVWNNVKYGWSLKQKSRFSRSSPLVMLGKAYELKDEEERRGFRRSFVSLLWFTYRRGFPQMGGGSLTSDSGWGCVLRTGQMLLAQGLLLHLLPSGWTWSSGQHTVKDDMDLLRSGDAAELNAKISKRGRKLSVGSLLDRPMGATHRIIVSWFADNPTAPFGIHNLVVLGESSGKKAGDWYGPSIVAHILRNAVAASAAVPNLVVYVAQDCTIYLQDVMKMCERPLPMAWKSLIILVPVRLGGQDLNPSYITCVKRLLSLDCCIGIIGGKPKHSLFFVGFQGDHLLYLDPHYCQPTVDVSTQNFSLESFHCKYPRKMLFSRMDPSCTIGFYAKGQNEFELLHTAVSEALSMSAPTYPMFIFSDGESEELWSSSTLASNVTYIQRETALQRVNTNDSMDEFVVL